jgi:hypothetical protein
MADYNSSLPVRTQNPGDVIVKISDATTPSQQASVSASGALTVEIKDSSGNSLNSTSNALNVFVTNTIPVTIGVADESSFTYGTSFQQVVGGVYNSSITQLTSGQQGALSVTSYRDLRVNLRSSAGVELGNSNADGLFVRPGDGTNSQAYTAAGEAKIDLTSVSGSALALGQTTMSASLPVVIASNQSAIPVSQSGAPWSVTDTNFPATVDTNYGTVGASTIRTAAQVGNSTGAADFNAGATGAQTLRVVANQGAANSTPWNENIAQIAGAVPSATNALPTQIATAGAYVSASNPLPVIVDPAGAGTPKNYYTDSSAIAAGSSSTQSTTVGGTTGFYLQQVFCTASGKFKAVVQVETGSGTNVFNIIFAAFNSTATPNATITLPSPQLVVTGARVQVIMTNNDLLAMDLYSTVSGFQV